jgi:hypothetical protein
MEPFTSLDNLSFALGALSSIASSEVLIGPIMGAIALSYGFLSRMRVEIQRGKSVQSRPAREWPTPRDGQATPPARRPRPP